MAMYLLRCAGVECPTTNHIAMELIGGVVAVLEVVLGVVAVLATSGKLDGTGPMAGDLSAA